LQGELGAEEIEVQKLEVQEAEDAKIVEVQGAEAEDAKEVKVQEPEAEDLGVQESAVAEVTRTTKNALFW
jgi:hypothetical protein